MLKVGLSGKIASGKSQVEGMLEKEGYLVFDLDEISHNLFELEYIQTLILEEFNTLDRKEISQIVFKNPEKKKKLENIIHPELKRVILDIFAKYKNERAIFISGALLFKSGLNKLFDINLFVDSKDEIRMKRLMKRNGLTRNEALARLNLQDDGKEADFIIQNNSDLDNLKAEVDKILKLIIR